MARHFPPMPVYGEAPEHVESESLIAADSDVEASEEEEDDEGGAFFLARRTRPADDLHDTAGSSPNNQDDVIEVPAGTSAPVVEKRAADAFADEESLWSS